VSDAATPEGHASAAKIGVSSEPKREQPSKAGKVSGMQQQQQQEQQEQQEQQGKASGSAKQQEQASAAIAGPVSGQRRSGKAKKKTDKGQQEQQQQAHDGSRAAIAASALEVTPHEKVEPSSNESAAGLWHSHNLQLVSSENSVIRRKSHHL
jgi:hypothetical protein